MSGRIVFFDLETGGLDSARHPIIELAAVSVDDQSFEPLAEFHTLVAFDEMKADAAALEVNHYDRARWAEAPSEVTVVDRFSRFLREHSTVSMMSKAGRPYTIARLAGHNAASFDFAFLRSLFERNRAFLPAAFQVLDTLQLALWRYFGAGERAPKNLKLETLVEHFGIARDGVAHSALSDVRATAALAKMLLEVAE